jgi:hypothetical protein
MTAGLLDHVDVQDAGVCAGYIRLWGAVIAQALREARGSSRRAQAARVSIARGECDWVLSYLCDDDESYDQARRELRRRAHVAFEAEGDDEHGSTRTME